LAACLEIGAIIYLHNSQGSAIEPRIGKQDANILFMGLPTGFQVCCKEDADTSKECYLQDAELVSCADYEKILKG
jgi:hypothetical protein